jgi:hypothetical protein
MISRAEQTTQLSLYLVSTLWGQVQFKTFPRQKTLRVFRLPYFFFKYKLST